MRRSAAIRQLCCRARWSAWSACCSTWGCCGICTRWSGEPMKRAFTSASANLVPASFALVMATGIVSIAAYRLELGPVAWALLVLNIAFYTILWLLMLVRLVWFLPRVLADFTNHARGAGFFTLVAG